MGDAAALKAALRTDVPCARRCVEAQCAMETSLSAQGCPTGMSALGR